MLTREPRGPGRFLPRYVLATPGPDLLQADSQNTFDSNLFPFPWQPPEFHKSEKQVIQLTK